MNLDVPLVWLLMRLTSSVTGLGLWLLVVELVHLEVPSEVERLLMDQEEMDFLIEDPRPAPENFQVDTEEQLDPETHSLHNLDLLNHPILPDNLFTLQPDQLLPDLSPLPRLLLNSTLDPMNATTVNPLLWKSEDMEKSMLQALKSSEVDMADQHHPNQPMEVTAPRPRLSPMLPVLHLHQHLSAPLTSQPCNPMNQATMTLLITQEKVMNIQEMMILVTLTQFLQTRWFCPLELRLFQSLLLLNMATLPIQLTEPTMLSLMEFHLHIDQTLQPMELTMLSLMAFLLLMVQSQSPQSLQDMEYQLPFLLCLLRHHMESQLPLWSLQHMLQWFHQLMPLHLQSLRPMPQLQLQAMLQHLLLVMPQLLLQAMLQHLLLPMNNLVTITQFLPIL